MRPSGAGRCRILPMIGFDNLHGCLASRRHYGKQSPPIQHHDPAARRRRRGAGPGQAPGTSARAGPRPMGRPSSWAPTISGRSPTLPRASTRGAPASRPDASNRSNTTRGVTGTRRKANVYMPPGLFQRHEVSRALPAARHRRRRDGMEALRGAGRPPRQSDRRQKRGADDRRDAQRPRARRRRATGNQFAPENVAGFGRFEQDLLGQSDSRDRGEVLGADRPRAPRARRPLDGRRADPQLRPRAPRHLRVGRRVLLRAEHKAARRTRARSRPRRRPS